MKTKEDYKYDWNLKELYYDMFKTEILNKGHIDELLILLTLEIFEDTNLDISAIIEKSVNEFIIKNNELEL